MLRNSLKRKIIFSLGFLLDAYEEMSIRNFYRKLYLPLYERTTISETISRMSKVGEIEKKIVRGEAVFYISAKGSKLLDELIPLKRLSDSRWDKLWRIVIFDIEEREKHIRDMVRRKLRSLGFAMWQESVYINPHPVSEEMNEFFAEKDLFPQCICFEAKQTEAFSVSEFAQYVFKTDELESAYKKLQFEISSVIDDFKLNKISKDQVYKFLRNFMEKLDNLICEDPFLPKELAPEMIEREKTKKLLSDFSKLIAKT